MSVVDQTKFYAKNFQKQNYIAKKIRVEEEAFLEKCIQKQ